MSPIACHILLIGKDQRLSEEINAAFAPHADEMHAVIRAAPDFNQGLESIRGKSPHLVLVDFRSDINALRSFARELRSLSPETVVAAVFERLPGDDRLEGQTVIDSLRAGVQDFLRRPLSWPEIRQLIDRALTQPGAREPEAGTLVSVISNKGGVGKSTISVNLACGLASRYPGQVLLIDSSVQLGVLAPMLDLHPKVSLLDAVRERHRLDATLLRSLTTAHSSGLHLLAAPSSALDANEITEEAFSQVLSASRRAFRFVVVDTFPLLNGLVISALDQSDLIYIVVESVIPTVLGASRLIELLQSMGYGPERQRIVLNRYSGFSGNLPQDIVSEKLERDMDYVLPYVRELLVAINLGQPLILYRRPDSAKDRLLRSLIDRLVASKFNLPGILRMNRQLEFAFEMERMVQEVEHYNGPGNWRAPSSNGDGAPSEVNAPES